MEATREFVPDPATARAFFMTLSQGLTLGRPEFLVQDAPADMNGLSDLTSITRAYEHGPIEAYPCDLEVIEQKPPFRDSQVLHFAVRILEGKSSPLKKMLEANYLHNKPADHGIIVLVPMMQGLSSNSYWGEPLVPSPQNVTKESLDAWIQEAATINGACLGKMG